MTPITEQPKGRCVWSLGLRSRALGTCFAEKLVRRFVPPIWWDFFADLGGGDCTTIFRPGDAGSLGQDDRMSPPPYMVHPPPFHVVTQSEGLKRLERWVGTCHRETVATPPQYRGAVGGAPTAARVVDPRGDHFPSAGRSEASAGTGRHHGLP